MEKFIRSFFSMKMMALAMVIFFIAIAKATFIESAYDTDSAKVLVYNAVWFEILLAYLGMSLIANMMRYRMWEKGKIAMFLFHMSFVVILIGAGVTRYYSYEGIMLIREGKTVDFLYSSNASFWYRLNDGDLQYTAHEDMIMSEHPNANNHFEHNFDFPKHKTPISIEYLDYQKNMIDSLVVNDSIMTTSLEIVTGGMTSSYLTEGDFLMLDDIAMSFDKENAMPGIEVFRKANKILIKTQLPIRYLPMAQMTEARKNGFEVADSSYKTIPLDTMVPFQTTTLYQVADQQFVFKSIVKNSATLKLKSTNKEQGATFLTVEVKDGELSKIVQLQGGQGMIPTHAVFELNGLVYDMEFGSRKIDLPFGIKCLDFRLERYPGVDMASSFESDVSIIDEELNYTRDQRIFMNNVMDYRGYRFFQSAYDPDEGGTHLSVNHDWWGTNITYLGYLIMTIGMIFTLIAPNGRFLELFEKLKKSRLKRTKSAVILIMLLSIGLSVNAQDTIDEHAGHDHSNRAQQKIEQAQKRDTVIHFISVEHSEKLSNLLVQDFRGRIVPFHTMSDQLYRKITKGYYKDYNAVQTIMSMHMYPDRWLNEKVIFVSSKSNLREKLGMKGKLISFNELLGKDGNFILTEDYEKAHQRLEMKRNEYDKKLIKLGERFSVIESVFSWRNMKIIPVKNDNTRTWFLPLNMELMKRDSIGTRKALSYLSSLNASALSENYGESDDNLKVLIEFQREVASDYAPNEKDIEREISFTRMKVFKNTLYTYLPLGLLMLILFFVQIFVNPASVFSRRLSQLTKLFVVVSIVAFLYHGYGIYLRMMITGHAPWSNGYEAIIFISWIIMLIGILFSRKHAVVLTGALIMASMMIFVTELNLMDPEITPLQPVLKSYWLMIHVAIITGSYAPLGISFILGFLSIILYIFRTKKNAKVINMNINELVYISELTITLGVFMLTIGTFLGGVWANESWGRYWGWDSKETWALVSVLVYAVILHLRYIPALKSKLVFSVVSMWGYTSILFTFFGVNFYLTGLHSYAQGEGMQRIPNWVLYVTLFFVLITFIAVIKDKRFKKSAKKQLLEL